MPLSEIEEELKTLGLSQEQNHAITLIVFNLIQTIEVLVAQLAIDDKTKLFNLVHFRKELEGFLVDHRSVGGCGLLFGDIAEFKRINDTLGHHIGDAVIHRVGRILEGNIKSGDNVVARYGEKADEFVIFFKSMQDQASLVDVCQRIRQLIRDYDWKALGLDWAVELDIGAIFFELAADRRIHLGSAAGVELAGNLLQKAEQVMKISKLHNKTRRGKVFVWKVELYDNEVIDTVTFSSNYS